MKVNAVDNSIFLSGTQKAKEMLYRHFAPKMYGICLRFAGNKMEADDILHESFVKILLKLKGFRNEGSLEGWIRRTTINTAINFYRKNSRYSRMSDIADIEIAESRSETIFDKISQEELLSLVQELPNGYRTVFNLNIMEGYTHKEIGKMLNISDNTSKSQLTRARQVLQKKVELMLKEKIKIPFNDFKVVEKDIREIYRSEKLLQAV